MNNQSKIEMAEELSSLWNELEESMGEQAAYQAACEQLGIDPDEGYGLLALLSEGESQNG